MRVGRLCGVYGVVVYFGLEGDLIYVCVVCCFGGDFDEKVVSVVGYDVYANVVGVGGGLKGDVIVLCGVFGYGFDVCVEIFGNVGSVVFGGVVELIDDDGAIFGVTFLVAKELIGDGAELVVFVVVDDFFV